VRRGERRAWWVGPPARGDPEKKGERGESGCGGGGGGGGYAGLGG